MAYKVCLDPGHGGIDLGLVAADGTAEKDITYRVAANLLELLADCCHIRLTRLSDALYEQKQGVPPQQRCALANEWGADLMLSLHCSKSPDKDASGVETNVLEGAPEATRRVALAIQGRLARLGLADRGVRESHFYVLCEAAMPAVLVKLGYLTNASDLQRLQDPDFCRRVAEGLAEALTQSLGLTALWGPAWGQAG